MSDERTSETRDEEAERSALIWLMDIQQHGGPLDRRYAKTLLNTLAWFEGAQAAKPASGDAAAATTLLRLLPKVGVLLRAAESVNENIMGNGLAYRRDALRYAIDDVRAVLSAGGDHASAFRAALVSAGSQEPNDG